MPRPILIGFSGSDTDGAIIFLPSIKLKVVILAHDLSQSVEHSSVI